MRRRSITPRRVLNELADIAFADLRQADLPVKAGDKLRALDLQRAARGAKGAREHAATP